MRLSDLIEALQNIRANGDQDNNDEPIGSVIVMSRARALSLHESKPTNPTEIKGRHIVVLAD